MSTSTNNNELVHHKVLQLFLEDLKGSSTVGMVGKPRVPPFFYFNDYASKVAA